MWVQKGVSLPPEIAAAVETRHLPIKAASKDHLSQLVGDSSHQGLVLESGSYPYSDIDSILALAGERNERPFLLLLDLLHGPQNIGALLRTAEACGVHGIVLQDRRAPDITPSVVVYSAGAAEHLRIAQVTNLSRTLERLKEDDLWIVGLDLAPEAQPVGSVDLDMALGIVIGHEGAGLRRLVRNKCDFLIKLPMRGQVASLNAASAGAIILYAAWQARGFEGAG